MSDNKKYLYILSNIGTALMGFGLGIDLCNRFKIEDILMYGYFALMMGCCLKIFAFHKIEKG